MTSADHPYLAGRKYRQDDIGEVLGQRNWWRTVSLLQTATLGLALVGMLYLGAQPKHIPVLIKWDSRSGEFSPVGIHPRAGEEPVSLRLMLHDLVTTLRGVSTDKELMVAQWGLAMQRLTKEGRVRLVQYETAWKPLHREHPVRIEMTSTLPITGHTWQARWVETTYDGHTGSVQGSQHMVGSFTYQLRTPTTLEESTVNPGGIWWHEWTIAPE